MTATNHALTGAFIGLTIGNPYIALPAALLSHFVCDAIPHFGRDDSKDNSWLRSDFFKRLLVLDTLLCFMLAGLIFAVHPYHWLLAIVCAFVATSPDFYWIGKFRRALAHKKTGQAHGFAYFASIIQWFQKPIGAVVEVAWLVALSTLVWQFLKQH